MVTPAGVTRTIRRDNVASARANNDKVLMRDTWPLLERIPFPALARGRLDTLQVNVGYRCNQSCVHCHVNAGPNRTEEMDGATELVRREMCAAYQLDPPLEVDVGVGPDWLTAK